MVWYAVAIGLTLLNKYLFTYLEGGEFNYPVSVSACHLILQFLVATALMQLRLRVEACGSKSAKTKAAGKLQTKLFEWNNFLILAVPVGAATAADIGLSNWSVTRVPVAVYTVAKGSSVVFNLLFSIMLGYQRFFPSVVGIVLLIFAGITMTSWSDDMQ